MEYDALSGNFLIGVEPQILLEIPKNRKKLEWCATAFLERIVQTNSIDEYFEEFQVIRAQLESVASFMSEELSEGFFLDLFIAGLEVETMGYVEWLAPSTVVEAKDCAAYFERRRPFMTKVLPHPVLVRSVNASEDVIDMGVSSTFTVGAEDHFPAKKEQSVTKHTNCSIKVLGEEMDAIQSGKDPPHLAMLCICDKSNCLIANGILSCNILANVREFVKYGFWPESLCEVSKLVWDPGGNWKSGTILVTLMWTISLHKQPKISGTQLAVIFPWAVVYMLGNVFTNMNLGKAAVTCAHTIEAMKLFFSVILSTIFLGDIPTPGLVPSLVLFVGGMASLIEASFNWAGFWSAMAANVTNQSLSVLSKQFMVNEEESLDNITLFSVVTIMSFLLFAPVVLFMEGVKVTPAYLINAELNVIQVQNEWYYLQWGENNCCHACSILEISQTAPFLIPEGAFEALVLVDALLTCVAFPSEGRDIADSTLQFWYGFISNDLCLDVDSEENGTKVEGWFVSIFSLLLDDLLICAQVIDLTCNDEGGRAVLSGSLLQFRSNLVELLVDNCQILKPAIFIQKIVCGGWLPSNIQIPWQEVETKLFDPSAVGKVISGGQVFDFSMIIHMVTILSGSSKLLCSKACAISYHKFCEHATPLLYEPSHIEILIVIGEGLERGQLSLVDEEAIVSAITLILGSLPNLELKSNLRWILLSPSHEAIRKMYDENEIEDEEALELLQHALILLLSNAYADAGRYVDVAKWFALIVPLTKMLEVQPWTFFSNKSFFILEDKDDLKEWGM